MSLLENLLETDPKKRLGAINDAADVKRHEFFDGIDWEAAANRRLKPPFIPEKTKGAVQTRNFDPYFLRMEAADSIVEDNSSRNTYNFKDFEFSKNSTRETERTLGNQTYAYDKKLRPNSIRSEKSV